MEIWKDIEGYEGAYQVSNLGNVRSLNYNNTGKVKNLKKQVTKRGRYVVGLSINGKSKTLSVSRLVAHAFIPNPNNNPQINHIDYNPKNNNVNNLEWCTNEENQAHAWGTGKRKSNKGFKFSEESKLKLSKAKKGVPNISKRKKVLCLNTMQIFNSITEASEVTGANRKNISSVCKGKRKTVNGYIFKYI